MAAVRSEHPEILYDHRARLTHLTHIEEIQPRLWLARQTLVTEDGDTMWMLETQIDLQEPREDEGPLIDLLRITT
jgi:hypothetical protein